MLKKITLLCMLAIGLVATSCKNDKEETDDTPIAGDYAGIVLNEVCGQSDAGDWIEFYNNSDQDVKLDGCTIIKGDEKGTSESIYTFPVGSILRAGSYIVVYGKDSKIPQFDKGISNSKEITITLKSPDGAFIDGFDRDANIGKDKGHDNNGSYARIPDGKKAGKWVVTTTATPGSTNRGEDQGGGTTETKTDMTGVVLNEICGLGNADDTDDWVEIYNSNAYAVKLDGAELVKDDKNTIYTFPTGSVIEAGGYIVLSTAAGQLTKNISNKKEIALDLKDATGKSVSRFDRDKDLGTDAKHDLGESYARVPNGMGKWKVTTATRGKSNS